MISIIQPNGSNRLRVIQNFLYFSFVGFIIAWILFSRLYDLDVTPPGLFFDESSIGYNAIKIMETGRDEYGVRYPVYFKSVGDYKNPIYIYAVTIVFSLFGVSEFTLRLTSVLFFLAALLFSVLLVLRVFRNGKIVAVYGLMAFGFSPLLFVISRVSFEVISQLAVISAAMYFIWMTFHADNDGKRGVFFAGLSGALLGLSTYCYTTQRLLSGLMLGTLWVVYLNRSNIRKLAWLSAAYSVLLIPFIIFAAKFPGAVTERFGELSYIDDQISLIEKAGLFIRNYVLYWSPDFLVIHGDPNLRHSTGHGGVFYWTVTALFVSGLVYLIKAKIKKNFVILILLNLLISPVAAALITEGAPHALRSMLMGYYIIFLSCYSLEWLSLPGWAWRYRSMALCVVASMMIFEITAFQRDYFFSYPARSVEAFGSFDLRSAFEFSLERHPNHIVAVGLPPGGYANVLFYSELIDNPGEVKILLADFEEPTRGLCIVFHRRTDIEGRLDGYSMPYEKFYSRKKLTPIDEKFLVEKFGGVIRVRCY